MYAKLDALMRIESLGASASIKHKMKGVAAM
jgi:hypothetical protein